MPTGWAIVVVVLAVAVIVLAAVVLGLMRQITPLLERTALSDNVGRQLENQGPRVGSPLPDFTALGADGEVSADQLRGQPAVLVFLSVGCGPCEMLAAELGRSELGDLARQIVVVTSPEGRTELGIPDAVPVLAERNREVSDRLSVMGTPFAVAIDPGGVVRATRPVNTLHQLDDLATQLA
jgi:hypothetical protein